jgi:hypothetical protein
MCSLPLTAPGDRTPNSACIQHAWIMRQYQSRAAGAWSVRVFSVRHCDIRATVRRGITIAKICAKVCAKVWNGRGRYGVGMTPFVRFLGGNFDAKYCQEKGHKHYKLESFGDRFRDRRCALRRRPGIGGEATRQRRRGRRRRRRWSFERRRSAFQWRRRSAFQWRRDAFRRAGARYAALFRIFFQISCHVERQLQF